MLFPTVFDSRSFGRQLTDYSNAYNYEKEYLLLKYSQKFHFNVFSFFNSMDVNIMKMIVIMAIIIPIIRILFYNIHIIHINLNRKTIVQNIATILNNNYNTKGFFGTYFKTYSN